MVAGPAGTAIARLIGGVADIPVAYLESFARGIRARTDAKDVVNKDIATAAAQFAVGESDLVARAAYALVAKEFRRQQNKEEIAIKTIELLQKDAAAADSQASTTPEGEPLPDVDADWLNIFERYAEDTTTRRTQRIAIRTFGEGCGARAEASALTRINQARIERTTQVRVTFPDRL
jgi:hypothetical protein